MPNHRHPHSALIDRVGTTQVRLAFGLTPQTLYMWRLRGVPAVKRFAFAELAATQAVELPAEFLADLRLSGIGKAA